MNRKQKTLLWSVLVLVLSLLGLGVNQQGKAGLPQVNEINQPGFHDVVEVLDGDTIKINLGGTVETIRMLGVDTPETHDPRKAVQCFGKAATDYSRGLMVGKTVRLEADPADSDRDKYYRLLRYVYLDDGRLVNGDIIKNGYGFAYTVFPVSKLEEFRNLEREARENNRGLWAGCTIDESKQIKQTNNQ